MNRIINLLFVIIALSLTSCAKERSYGGDRNIITIKAIMSEASSKTVIQDGTTTVLWEPGDAVNVFYKTTGSRFISNNTEPAGTADFTGNLSVTGFFTEGFTADTPLWAVYPYRSDATSDGNSVTTTLPAKQVARAGSFAKSTHITLAKSSNTTMGFYNVSGGVRFALTHENVKEVVFSGRNGEDIAGKVKLSFADGVPIVQAVLEGQKAITVTAPDNGTFEIGKWYYIVALPGSLSNGFQMTFSTATQFATLDSPGPKTIGRGIFGSLNNADKDLVWTDKGGDDPASNIDFVDMAAKYACVEKFDKDGDGEVSIKEAEAATSFSGLFADWKTVEHFNEIRYFRNVHNISGVFSGCDKLVSITLPENITDLGTNAFSGCSSLSSIVLPGSISCIGRETFQGCSSLGSIIIPSGVISINENAFIDCSKLTTVELPLGLSSISQRAFQNCSSLCSVNFPSSLKSIGWAAFYGCSSLASVDLPNQLTSIDGEAFSNCSSLASVALSENIRVIPDCCFQNTALNNITLPAALTTIGSKAFAGCSFEESGSSLHIPASVTSIGSGAFEGVRHLILHSNSPVSIAPDSFAVGYTVFYVPSNLVEMLKVRTNWSNYADRIRPISDYPLASIPTPGTVGEPVDLGLSVKWASWNVGASAPEEIGSGFAWGETEIDWYYDWKHYKWFDDVDKQTKYNSSDGKTVLDLEDDAAHINWGGTWRMPTKAEWQELLTKCSTERIQNETPGYRITGPNGNSIFLRSTESVWPPSTNMLRGFDVGYYWSASLGDQVAKAWYVSFFTLAEGYDFLNDPRYYGYLVRPVTE